MNAAFAAAICFFVCIGLANASSIYVKNGYRAGAGARATRLGPGEAILTPTVCEDTSEATCQKIQQWYGARACSREDDLWAETMKQICPRTCGFCECKDKYEALCLEYSHHCSKEGDLGSFMKEICAKTCGACSAEVVPLETGHL